MYLKRSEWHLRTLPKIDLWSLQVCTHILHTHKDMCVYTHTHTHTHIYAYIHTIIINQIEEIKASDIVKTMCSDCNSKGLS